MHAFLAADWQDYELLDCGNYQKLERFGRYVLIRPEPQALWKPVWEERDWLKLAHLRFVQETSSSGRWEKLKPADDEWQVQYTKKGLKLAFQLRLNNFKHVGVFPEQASNWHFMHDFCRSADQPKVLNLFAYTGGASLAAKAGGADVVHVDSVRSVVNWASQNQQLSHLEGIRWTVEDALLFAQREQKRGRKYQGIIMDPPSYGLGPKGERWKLEEQLPELLETAAALLDERQHCFILNTYSLNLSSMLLHSLCSRYFALPEDAGFGELYVPSKSHLRLPLGSYIRWSR